MPKRTIVIINLFLLLTFNTCSFANVAITEKKQPQVKRFNVNQTDEIVEELKQSGAVIVEQALQQNKISTYADKIIHFFDYMDKKAKTVTSEQVGWDADILRCFNNQGGFAFSYAMDDYFETPRGFRQIFLMINEAGLMKIAKKFLNGNVGFLIDGSSARRQSPKFAQKGLPFHQDSGVLGYQSEGLVFWVPLVPIDNRTPGLEVVAKKIDKNFKHQANTQGFAVLSSPEVMTEFENDTVAPQMNPGDVLVFTLPTIHRSYITPEMDKPRYSLDLRCVRADQIPEIYYGTYLMLDYDKKPSEKVHDLKGY